ncbi:glutamate racemase [Altericroceibacterium endophyticum]|uniref:Glutamate racemase n=1 Tax=Altericroceibacterium endophyticum TaxID=1808508 RepID=A0A6I4T1D7_9SPHN|nr:glutamate racemase [Altericroceibacterium endophyticum]MXO64767.1 glutamate racemase [Altericroceibacterium endophyticum]
MNTDPSSPLLLFDSGVGGLSVLAEIRRLMPDAPVIYAADTAALPYGEKTEEQIAARVPALLGRLVERYRPRLITIACNTASTIALPAVREALDLPIVGTVPAIKPAAALTRAGAIGLLGTAATIRQAYVDNLEHEFAQGKQLIRYAAPALVAAAEAKLRGETPDPAIFAEAAQGLRDRAGNHEIDTVVLACTHFPLVEAELGHALGQNVQFVHGAAGIARRVAHLTKGQEFLRKSPDSALFTGKEEDVDDLLPALRQYGIDHIDRI